MSDYAAQVREFAAMGAEIMRLDPKHRYGTIGKDASRPLEPGFIPVDAPAKIVTVSYYPNATELPTTEYARHRESMRQWASSATVDAYTTAYNDWVAFLTQVPFYRDFNMPIFSKIGISAREYAWLPLIKCPLPARTSVPEEDMKTDRMLLWDQLWLLKPKTILAQGMQAYDVVRGMCEDKFEHRLVLQKIGRVGTNAYHAEEDARVVRELSFALSKA